MPSSAWTPSSTFIPGPGRRSPPPRQGRSRRSHAPAKTFAFPRMSPRQGDHCNLTAISESDYTGAGALGALPKRLITWFVASLSVFAYHSGCRVGIRSGRVQIAAANAVQPSPTRQHRLTLPPHACPAGPVLATLIAFNNSGTQRSSLCIECRKKYLRPVLHR
jgi:hypothetical protein